MNFSHIAVIYNPKSGRPRERLTAVKRLAKLLRAAGRTVEILGTGEPGQGAELARQALAQGCDLVIAHGGDGTMNEVLQGVVGSDATLGFWPGGTANVLAAELRFPTAVDDVVEHILAGNVMRATVGRANDRYFLLMAGVGLDAAVAARVDNELKKRLGKGAFVVSALEFFRDWNLPCFRVELDDEQIDACFLVAGNAQSYGGGFRITPRADLSDPNLDLCIFTSDRRVDYLRFALGAAVGSHLQMEGVTYRKVSRARIISTSDEPAPIQLDGEVVGTLPLVLEAVPDAVNLLV